MGLVPSAYLYEGVNREMTIVLSRLTPSNADGEKFPWNVNEFLLVFGGPTDYKSVIGQ
jgi:hypothetical protein